MTRDIAVDIDAERIGEDQVAALFAALPLGVLGAALAAAILSFALARLGGMEWQLLGGWTGYIAACAALHLLLHWHYRKRKAGSTRWRLWATAFFAISLLEGIGWGWIPIATGIQSGFEIEMLALTVTLGIAAASVPAFSPFLPAFAAFFLPATVPYAIWSIIAVTPLHQATATLMALFVPAIFGLGVISRNSFRQLVLLRIQTAALAEDLRKQKEIAEAANLAKSAFLAAASHDLRQPVHALGLFVGALRGVAMPSEGERIVEQIEASANAMDGLFAALLDISRLDAGTIEVANSAFALSPFLERICRDHIGEAAAKGVRISVMPTRLSALTDPVLLERVIRNLVSNAVRYTDTGRILVGCRARDSSIAIQVWDSGRGIPADQLDRVFEEYYQIDNPQRDRSRGLGLGLAIVRRLTDLLGCRLSVRSRPGYGSCFDVTVPAAAAIVHQTIKQQSGALRRMTIVVVDDELAIREGMVLLLGSWGHEVIVAGSGAEILSLLTTHPRRPDLIICDYRLRHGENGRDVVEVLQAEYNEAIPTVLITGDTAPDRLAEAQASGLLLLHKPVSNSKLRAAIANLARAAGGGDDVEPSG